MDKTLLILAHGSKAQSTTKVIYQVRDEIAKRNLYKDVKVAFMEFNHPNIREAFDEIYKKGSREVIAVPMFLFEGNHIRYDIPEELANIKNVYPDLEISLAKPIGFDRRVADILIERAAEKLWKI